APAMWCARFWVGRSSPRRCRSTRPGSRARSSLCPRSLGLSKGDSCPKTQVVGTLCRYTALSPYFEGKLAPKQHEEIRHGSRIASQESRAPVRRNEQDSWWDHADPADSRVTGRNVRPRLSRDG